MKKRPILGIAILMAFCIVQSACKDRGNPLDRLFPRTQNTAHNYAEPLASIPVKNNAEINPVKANTSSPSEKLFQPELLEKISSEMTAPPPPPFSPLLPEPPPPVPVPEPIPVDDLNGFVEYDGPIYSLCGNGVLNRVVNRIACPSFAPTPVFGLDSAGLLDVCVGFVYIEQCDDGNIIDNDGCSSVCLKECCGNGIVEDGEECDLGQNSGPILPNISPPANFPITGAATSALDATIFTTPFAPCSRPDLVTDTTNCSRNCQYIICGDGIVNGNEQCDDGNNLCCDGCFKCTIERPGACPCNCCPDPGVAICNNVCCKPNEKCDPLDPPTPPAVQVCRCSGASCNNGCCKDNETCNAENECACQNAVCPNGVCCEKGQICNAKNVCETPTS